MNDISENFEDALTQALKGIENLTSQKITEFAVSLAPVFGVTEDKLAEVIKSIESRFMTKMEIGVSLIDENSVHNEIWYKDRNDIDWNYWNDYEKYLIMEGLGPKVVSILGDVTEKILGLLQDPFEQSDWDRRGLVIGHVQSGKTANYIGLITKAADAGYRFIIIIAGIHNNLRKQTQERIDKGFVGLDSSPDKGRKNIGVGILAPKRIFPLTLTSTDKDFNKMFATQMRAGLKDINKPVVVVIKKNVKTLNNLYTWLKEWNIQESSGKIADIPMLMIDDEADNASINTNKPEFDPTSTNKEIRKILSLFKKSCYIGYTATPFANIFINPDTEDEMLKDDLFPKDFIYCLDAPTNYFGPQKVFIDELSSRNILRTIDDSEELIPLSHKKDLVITDLPHSLRTAIHVFMIGKAIRNLKGQKNKHASMMVNVSRFVDVQRQVRDLISTYLKDLANNVRYNYAFIEKEAMENPRMKFFKEIFEQEFNEVDLDWAKIQGVLSSVIDSVNVILVNSQSDEALDYKVLEESGDSANVIAVGGLSLSRGLTLEGLMVSYMYRNTKMCDTLMQMGRWFGYRGNYENLCRVYLPVISQGWYEDVAERIEELRQQIKYMRREHLTPKKFGLYVRAHPDALIITALNKMRHAQKITISQNLSGRVTETYIVPSIPDIVENNQKLICRFFNKLINDYSSELRELPDPAAYYWSNISRDEVVEFLIGFQFHEQLYYKKELILKYLNKLAEKYPEIDVAFISLKKLVPDSINSFSLSEKYRVACQKRSAGVNADNSIRKPDSDSPGYYVTNKQRVASPGIEVVGLSHEQISMVDKPVDGAKVSDIQYRAVRGKPLLMLHILNIVSGKGDDEKILLSSVPAISVSFPGGDYSSFVEIDDIYANPILKKQLEEELRGDMEEEDDYDYAFDI